MLKKIAQFAALALLASGCMKPYVIVQDVPEKMSASYSAIDLEFQDKAFLKTMEGNKNYDNYITEAAGANEMVKGRLGRWLDKNFKGAGKAKARLVAEISEFKTGSTAARIFAGSLGDGFIKYKVSIYSGDKLEHQFFTNEAISENNAKSFGAAMMPGIGMEKVNAYNNTADDMARYIADHNK